MSFTALCLAVSVFVVVNGAWNECDGGKKISSVKCNGADMATAAECILAKGKNASLTVEFTSDVSVNSLKSVCHGVIGGIPIPFDKIDHLGCDGIKPGCPIKSGTTYTFTANIFVSDKYPSLRLAIKWEEQDSATGKDLWCLILPAQIK